MPEPVAERVETHYAAARQAARVVARDYQVHAATVAVAHGGDRAVRETGASNSMLGSGNESESSPGRRFATER